MATLGVGYPREFAAGQVLDVARSLEAGGVAELWVVEDCFYTTGVTLAAAALAVTDRLTVGLGILPAVARNPVFTAMEIATLAGLASGRVVAGIGHGMPEWMAQIGAATPSPVTTLREVLQVVRRLLRGETVTERGRVVHLDDCGLVAPPTDIPPVLAGVRGPRSVAMAGQCADGLVLADGSPPSYVRWAREQAAAPGRFEIAVLVPGHLDRDRAAARRQAAPRIADLVRSAPPGLRGEPFFAELAALVAERGPDGVLAAPDEWWPQLGAFGTPEDAAAHIAALAAAGADRVSLSFDADPATWAEQVRRVGADLVSLLD
jgi:alkanesulfonate monooxygenase SsuD/methylene tetrahydromethanopterin reductase-like flavin-dependent oxidoreductase (luciferase family)